MKSGERFDWEPHVTLLFLCVISILFLIFDWPKLHLLWVVPIIFIVIPFVILKKIPIIYTFVLFATKKFGKIVLAGLKTNTEPSEREESDDDREEESDDDREEESDEEDEEDEKITEGEVQIEKKDPLERYKKIRETGRNLTGQMMKHAPKFAITKTASDLNLKGPKGILVFDSESDTPFMMDRCFYDIFWDGKNLISHFMETEDYQQLSEEEQVIVQGMTTAYYSLFEVKNVDPSESSLEFKDLLDTQTYTITDINLSRTAHTGYLLAARIHQTEGIFMTTGAVCPFGVEQKQNLLDGLEPKKISAGKKKKTKRLQRSDYSAYFFKRYKRTEGIKFTTVDEIE